MNPDQIIVFLDNLQRTIVATLDSESQHVLTVTKPAILNVVPTAEKKLQVQLYPVMFREFLANRDTFPKWNYPRSSVVVADDVKLEPNLLNQYVEMFKVANNQPAPTIKLFDTDEPKKG